MKSDIERPQYYIIGFKNNNVNEQNHDAKTFDIIIVIECYCTIGSEFYPEHRIKIIMVLINIMRFFEEILNFNKDYNGLPHNTKLDIIQRTFKTSYRIYVFGTRYKSDHIGPLPIQLSFYFSVAVADVICHALV